MSHESRYGRCGIIGFHTATAFLSRGERVIGIDAQAAVKLVERDIQDVPESQALSIMHLFGVRRGYSIMIPYVDEVRATRDYRWFTGQRFAPFNRMTPSAVCCTVHSAFNYRAVSAGMPFIADRGSVCASHAKACTVVKA